MTISVTVRQEGNFAADELQSTVTQALAQELQLARAKRDLAARECLHYEQRYGMSTADFLTAFESGAMGDDEDFFEWFGAARARSNWERRVHMLSGVSVEPA